MRFLFFLSILLASEYFNMPLTDHVNVFILVILGTIMLLLDILEVLSKFNTTDL